MAKIDKENGVAQDIDYVGGVPDSGTPHAIGYANESHIPFARAFIKYTPTWSRSFTASKQKERSRVAKMKQIPVHELIRGKKLLFVDDSIVRGTQLKETVDFLYDHGAAEVHMRSACPPIMHSCKYLNFSRSSSPMELIARKVKRTVVMGGRFFEGWPMGVIHGKDPVVRECNIIHDIAAAQTVCREWQGELIFASFELGNDCITLQNFAKNADYNPAALAYRLYPPAGLRGRESWDLIAMLYAVRPQGEAFKLHPWGKISVSDDGVTSFRTDKAGRHSFLLPHLELSLVRDEINAIVRGSRKY
jgi:hypothetical protein